MRLFKEGMADLVNALLRYRAWMHLGFLEVKQRYQRSILGPWWVTLSMLLFISAMGVIFSRILVITPREYVPFFAAGYVLWTFISSCINESTELFRAHMSFVKQTTLPFNLYLCKFFTKNLILLAHNLIAYFAIICFFRCNPGWCGLLGLIGLVLLLFNLYWICLLIALLSTRFRDVVPIVSNCLQILFFMTPISWTPKLLSQDSVIVKYNPFVYFIDVVRLPLLGKIPSAEIWVVASLCALCGSFFSMLVFSYTRSNIPFWID